MINIIKYIDIKNHTYYFSHDIINIKTFDPKNIKTHEKSHKNTLVYYIGYVTIKDLKYVKTDIVNPLHLIMKKLVKVSI